MSPARHAARKQPTGQHAPDSARHKKPSTSEAPRYQSRRKSRQRARQARRAGTPIVGTLMLLGAAIGGVQAYPRGPVPSAETPTAAVKPLSDLVSDQKIATEDGRAEVKSTARSSSEREKGQEASGNKEPAESPADEDVTATAKATAKAEPKPDEPPFPPVEGCAAIDDATIAAAQGENGHLDDSALCDVGNGHRLRPDAVAAFVALSEAYANAGGGALIECVTDSYRSYELQVDLKLRKPVLAARPGTSNHGWGVAVDFACDMDSYSSTLYAWLTDHGPTFGWTNPAWALQTGSKPEPWHWEFDSALLE